MSGTVALGSETGAVTAGLHYTVDTGVKPVNETFGPNNIRRRVSGEHEVRQMTIRNGRPLADELDLEVTGFEFVGHPTRVRDFFDAEELKRVYYPEVEALVKKVSGAARVVVFDHTLRSGDEAEREAKLVREPVLYVHNDYTEWSGPQRVRDLLPGEAEALLQGRFAIIQVSRAINRAQLVQRPEHLRGRATAPEHRGQNARVLRLADSHALVRDVIADYGIDAWIGLEAERQRARCREAHRPGFHDRIYARVE